MHVVLDDRGALRRPEAAGLSPAREPLPEPDGRVREPLGVGGGLVGEPGGVAAKVVGYPAADLTAGAHAVLEVGVTAEGERRRTVGLRAQVAQRPPLSVAVLVGAVADAADHAAVEGEEVGIGGLLLGHRAKKSNAFP